MMLASSNASFDPKSYAWLLTRYRRVRGDSAGVARRAYRIFLRGISKRGTRKHTWHSFAH